MFPLSIWVPQEYPKAAPMALITPTVNMLIRPGQHVSGEGRIYHPYLAGWLDDVSRFHHSPKGGVGSTKIAFQFFVDFYRSLEAILGVLTDYKASAIEHYRVSFDITRTFCKRPTCNFSTRTGSPSSNASPKSVSKTSTDSTSSSRARKIRYS